MGLILLEKMTSVRIIKTIYKGGKVLLKKGRLINVKMFHSCLFYVNEKGESNFLPKDSYSLYSGFPKDWSCRE